MRDHNEARDAASLAQRKLLRRTIGALVALLAIGVAGRLLFPPPPAYEGIIPAESREAIDVSIILPTLGDKKIDLSHPPGKVMLINFWATWCGPCVAEMPSLEALHQALGSEGLYMIGITNDPPSGARRFVADHGITFDIASDPASRLQRKLRLGPIPDTFVIDAKGRLALRIRGASNWAEPKLIEALRKLLKES